MGTKAPNAASHDFLTLINYYTYHIHTDIYTILYIIESQAELRKRSQSDFSSDCVATKRWGSSFKIFQFAWRSKILGYYLQLFLKRTNQRFIITDLERITTVRITSDRAHFDMFMYARAPYCNRSGMRITLVHYLWPRIFSMRIKVLTFEMLGKGQLTHLTAPLTTGMSLEK